MVGPLLVSRSEKGYRKRRCFVQISVRVHQIIICRKSGGLCVQDVRATAIAIQVIPNKRTRRFYRRIDSKCKFQQLAGARSEAAGGSVLQYFNHESGRNRAGWTSAATIG